MRPILIGAGRGRRLGPNTDSIPKTLVPVMGRPMLDWILEALAEAGFAKKDVVFVCGYKADVLRARHPELTYVENRDWESNNILASLFYAREHMKDGFVSSYTDILYRGEIVSKLMEAPGDRVLACDIDWRRRYVNRSQHPESDGEKMCVEKGGRVTEISRTIPSDRAHGEFIGVAKFSAAGAKDLIDAYDGATLAPKAYLIELFQRMIPKTDFRHVDTPGGYMEIDTEEDLAAAAGWWK